ncbi:MAG: hypothetical protein RLZZ546_2817 [Bacteroidota bacterium]|jgi:pimeloyl-ACP methyl ester carboxylesterase
MKNIYLFSGLGADARVFQKLNLGDHSFTHIQWLQPSLQKQEDIKEYCERLSQQIITKNPIFIGLSFGGLIAIEISKLIHVEKIILISSISMHFELPYYYKWFGKLNAHKILPSSLLKKSNFITNFLFGVDNPEECLMLKEILKDTDPIFLRWAIHQIINWKNENIPDNLVVIHGDKDKLLPHRFKHKIDCIIENGGHLMIISKCDQVSDFLLSTI